MKKTVLNASKSNISSAKIQSIESDKIASTFRTVAYTNI